MNKIIKYTLFGVGGLALFLGTYVGIAIVSGAPLHEVPGLNQFVKAPEVPEGAEVDPDLAQEDMKREERVGSDLMEANVGLLGAFMMDSPFSASDLKDLQRELKQKLREQSQERQAMDARALELDEWDQALRERQAELADRRTKLEEMESQIEIRFSELEYTERINQQREKQGWRKLAEVYSASEPRAAAIMLLEEDPKDAALILDELEPKQAGDILRAIPTESDRKKYMDAYREVVPADE